MRSRCSVCLCVCLSSVFVSVVACVCMFVLCVCCLCLSVCIGMFLCLRVSVCLSVLVLCALLCCCVLLHQKSRGPSSLRCRLTARTPVGPFQNGDVDPACDYVSNQRCIDGLGVWSGTPIRDASCCCHPLSGVPCLRFGPRRCAGRRGLEAVAVLRPARLRPSPLGIGE